MLKFILYASKTPLGDYLDDDETAKMNREATHGRIW